MSMRKYAMPDNDMKEQRSGKEQVITSSVSCLINFALNSCANSCVNPYNWIEKDEKRKSFNDNIYDKL